MHLNLSSKKENLNRKNQNITIPTMKSIQISAKEYYILITNGSIALLTLFDFISSSGLLLFRTELTPGIYREEEFGFFILLMTWAIGYFVIKFRFYKQFISVIFLLFKDILILFFDSQFVVYDLYYLILFVLYAISIILEKWILETRFISAFWLLFIECIIWYHI